MYTIRRKNVPKTHFHLFQFDNVSRQFFRQCQSKCSTKKFMHKIFEKEKIRSKYTQASKYEIFRSKLKNSYDIDVEKQKNFFTPFQQPIFSPSISRPKLQNNYFWIHLCNFFFGAISI